MNVTSAPADFAAPERLPLADLGERLVSLRLTDPVTEQALLHSLQQYGQLTPLIACRYAADQPPELLDGFKRLRVCRQLGWATVAVRPMAVPLRAGKAALVHFNRVGRDISGMEEALVVHSLCHEDGLTQVEIARLLGHHKSWVCRRLTLIERLSDEVQNHIRLGLLPPSLGAELARLQRCNQERLVTVIREHGLTWRETRQVVAALLTKGPQEREAILRQPRMTVTPAPRSARRDSPAQRLMGRLLSLEQQCREVTTAVTETNLDHCSESEVHSIRRGCAQAALTLEQTREALRSHTRGGADEHRHS